MKISVFFAFLIASAASAQPITVIPSQPTAGAPFIVRVEGLCSTFSDPTIHGPNIDIQATGGDLCCGGCYTRRDETVGPFPVGTYTVRLFLGDSTSPYATQQVQVIAPVPALDPRVLAMLAVALIVVALARIRPG